MECKKCKRSTMNDDNIEGMCVDCYYDEKHGVVL